MDFSSFGIWKMNVKICLENKQHEKELYKIVGHIDLLFNVHTLGAHAGLSTDHNDTIRWWCQMATTTTTHDGQFIIAKRAKKNCRKVVIAPESNCFTSEMAHLFFTFFHKESKLWTNSFKSLITNSYNFPCICFLYSYTCYIYKKHTVTDTIPFDVIHHVTICDRI